MPLQDVPMQQDMKEAGSMPTVYIAKDPATRQTQEHAITGFMPSGRYLQPTSSTMKNGNWRRAYISVKWEKV